MEWMILPLKRYFDFQGRSQRMEFWMFVLFNIIVAIVAGIIDMALGFGSTTSYSSATGAGAGFQSNGPVNTIASLALLIPNIAVAVRRLHDTDRTGWWILLPVPFVFVGIFFMFAAIFSGGFESVGSGFMIGMLAMALAFVGWIVLIVFYCLDGTQGPNRFGPDPKDPHGADDVAEVFN